MAHGPDPDAFWHARQRPAEAIAVGGRKAGPIGRALARGLDAAVDAAKDAADQFVVGSAAIPTDGR